MNIKRLKNTKQITIRIEFKSQEQFDLFGAMLNCSPICDAMIACGFYLNDANEQLEACGAMIHGNTKYIAEALCDTDYIKTRMEKVGAQ